MGQERLSASPNPEVFIPRQQEEEYCRAHQIELERLPNGITIIGIPRQVSDLAQASVNFTFPSGSFFDPPGKEGLHHLIEHLLIPTKRKGEAYRLNVSLNAQTGPLEVIHYCSGPTHPQVRDFGLWSFLPIIRQDLAYPSQFLSNPPEVIGNEKEVIKAEIVEGYARHEWHVSRYLTETVFGSQNPYFNYGTGTAESLTRIDTEDVKNLIEEVLIPKGLIISILSEGDSEICRLLTDRLVAYFADFPREDKAGRQIDYSLLEKLNPDFKPGAVYEKDTHLRNGLITIMPTWTFRSPLFTPSQFALSRVALAASGKLFDLSRKRGWAYTSGADSMSLTGQDFSTGAFFMRLDIPKPPPGELRGFWENILPEIKKGVLEAFDDGQIEEILQRERQLKEAIPIPTSLRLIWLLSGLKQWGEMIDADKIQAVYRQINATHLRQWRDKFLSEEPALIVVGDLS